MAQNFNLGTLGQVITVNTAANTVAYTADIKIGNSSVNTSINSTAFTGSANNTSFVGSVSAANVVSNTQLSSNLANYQTTAGLSANVATLTANNTSFVGSVSAANVVSNSQLSSNLANYQTTAGLSSNVATLTANSANYVKANNGITSNSSGVFVTQGDGVSVNSTGVHVKANTGIFANSSGTFVNSSYIATLDANNAAYLGGVAAGDYQTEAGLSANVATLTANNTSFVGSVSAANVVSNSQLSSNLANYQTTAGLSANVATLTANNANYVKANNGITSNSSGVFVTQGDGTTVNSTGVHVRAGNTQLISNSTGVWANQANFDHNSLSNYDANKHVDHTTVTFTAGAGLTGGGTIAASRTFDVGAGNGVAVDADSIRVVAGTDGGLVSNSTGVFVTAGQGLLTNSTGLHVGVANGITGAADSIAVTEGVGIAVNTTGVHVKANNGITANSTGTFVTQGTGTVVNATGVHVNQTLSLTTLSTTGNVTVGGNLTVSGNVVVIGANNLSIVDNFIYLNSNNTAQNIDLGFAGNYNDGTYKHAGFFRDATDGFWKPFDGYTPEPDAAVDIDTSNNTFNIAGMWFGNTRIGNTTVYATINSTAYSGSANDSTYLGGYTFASPPVIGSSIANGISLTYANVSGQVNAATLLLSTNTATIGTGTYFVSNGNVGIGNTAPAHKLRVTGTTSLAGAVTDITTLATGSTTITGFANVSGNGQFTGNVGIGVVPANNVALYLAKTWDQNLDVYSIYNGVIDNNTAMTVARTKFGSATVLTNYNQNKSSDGLTSYGSTYYGSYNAMYNGSTVTGGDANASLMTANFNYIGNWANGTSANTITTARAMFTQVEQRGGIITAAEGIRARINGSNTLSSNITTAYSMYADILPAASGPTIGTGYLYYGVYGAGTVSTKYGLYLNGEGNNYLSGNLVVAGTVNATSGLMTSYANVTGQVNTATLYATTSANVGANVQLTTSAVSVSNTTGNTQLVATSVTVQNSTVNAVMGLNSLLIQSNTTVNSSISNTTIQVANSSGNVQIIATQVKVANSTGTANLNATSLVIGNTTIQTTNAIFGGTIAANGGIGSAGQVLTSSGAGNVYWTAGVNTAAQYTWTNTHIFNANVSVNAVFNVTNSTANVFYAAANGNVGIGTSSPSSSLEVLGTIGSRSGGTTGAGLLATIVNNYYSGPNYITSYIFQYDTAAVGTFLGSSKATMGGLVFTNVSSAVITTSSTATAPLILGTNDTERMRITASGNVGIGTSSPSYTLQVNGSFAATTKSFVINHPTKPDMKLRYGSLEGPENGVYVRGRVQGPYIYLPEHWEGLVDENSVTVSLTPIAKTQMPSVLSFNNQKIVLHSDTPIDCFYHVFGERKDVEKLVVEF